MYLLVATVSTMKFLHQNHIKYALIMTAIIVVCLMLMEVTGQNKTFDHSPFAFIFTMIAPVIVWYLGIRAKKKQLKGKLSYKQGVMEGLKIGIVYGVISPFIFLAYYLLVNPGIIAYVRTVYQMRSTTSDMTVIFVDLVVQFAASIVFGLIYGLIFSIFLRSKKK